LSGRRQNADIADTLYLRDVAMSTTFCLSMAYNFGCICYNWIWRLMGHNFGCMIVSDTQFDSRGGFSGSSYPMKTADFEVRRDVAMATILAFYIWVHIGATWRIRLNRPCAAVMRRYVKLLWPLVIIIIIIIIIVITSIIIK